VTTTVVVSGAGGNIGTNMIRSLRDCEESFRIIGTEANTYYRHLSIADETFMLPYATIKKDSYLKEMESIIHQQSADILLISNTQEIVALSQHYNELPISVPLPSSQTIMTLADKWISYQQWDKTNVPVPDTVRVSNSDDIYDFFELIDGPVWVREFTGSNPVAGRIFRNPDLVECWIEQHKGWGSFTMSEYLPGTDCSWLGVFKEGELITSQGRERLAYSESEQWGTGAPSVSKTVSRSDINAIGEKAIRTVSDSPHGVFFTDMREDDDEQLKVTEVNPGRLGTTTSAFFPRAGLNIPKLLVDMARDRDITANSTYNALESGQYYIRKHDCDPVIVTEDQVE